MVGAILTAEEVREITGARQRAACIRVLEANGVPYLVAADGWPRVHVDALPEGVVSLTARRSARPNLDAF